MSDYGQIDPLGKQRHSLRCRRSKGRQVHLFYRAEDKSRGQSWGTSRIGMAVNEDGRNFQRHPVPVLYPGNDFIKEYEWPGGCQDPRIAEAEDGSYLMTYTAWDGETARLCCAASKGIFLIYNAGANGRPDLGLNGNVWDRRPGALRPQRPNQAYRPHGCRLLLSRARV